MRLLRLIIGWFLFLLGALHTISGLVYLIWTQLNPEFVSVQPMMISSVILGIPPIAAGWYLVATASRRVAGRATISSAVLRSASDRHA
jgi:polyferredoxin